MLLIDRLPLVQLRLSMNYNVNKMLDVHMIFPQPDPDDPASDYPNSSLTVQLSSKVLPVSLVATLRKKSEAMVKKLVYGPSS